MVIEPTLVKNPTSPLQYFDATRGSDTVTEQERSLAISARPHPSHAITGFPNLSPTLHPFSISTDEHVPRKFLMTKEMSKITKIHRI